MLGRLSMPPIYLDYQSTTPTHPSVVEKMTEFWSLEFGNPHSTEHFVGRKAGSTLSKCRQTVANFVGAFPEDVIFTSGATEANNLAILGHRKRGREISGKSIAYVSTEHKCVIQASKELASEAEARLVAASVDASGQLDYKTLEDELSNGCFLVSVMLVNNEIGAIQDIERVSALCRQYGALLHCDASQAPSTMMIDFLADYADTISLSSHKMYGPKGIGALVAMPDVRENLQPLNFGGGQENGLRSGTVALPLCVGFAAACDFMTKSDTRQELENSAILRNLFWQTLVDSDIDVALNGPDFDSRHICNLNVSFKHKSAKAILDILQPNVCASSGAACASGVEGPSETLLALGLGQERANSSIRFSFGLGCSEHEVLKAAELTCAAARDV